MAEADKVFAGSIPAIYEQLLVPMIFEPYARDIAARVAGLKPASVLELAAGTGAVTRAMDRVLGPDVQITATDLNQPMLDMAMAQQKNGTRITWQQADAMSLPFAEQSFDVLVCQFGVMFFPDKLQSYRESLRVLRVGGTYIFAVWDKVANNDFIAVVNRALASEFPADPPLFMERMPHGYHDLDQIGTTVKGAGFSAVTLETVDHKSVANSALDAATAYCQGNPLRGEIEARAPGRLEDVTHHVARTLRHEFGEGAIDGRIRAHIITAIR
ncbi:MAG: SAM-dependent methyltransferase [Rhizobium sp.]|nr:SAM-dependent methyltransferase [Rhizobium sp.]